MDAIPFCIIFLILRKKNECMNETIFFFLQYHGDVLMNENLV